MVRRKSRFNSFHQRTVLTDSFIIVIDFAQLMSVTGTLLEIIGKKKTNYISESYCDTPSTGIRGVKSLLFDCVPLQFITRVQECRLFARSFLCLTLVDRRLKHECWWRHMTEGPWSKTRGTQITTILYVTNLVIKYPLTDSNRNQVETSSSYLVERVSEGYFGAR